MKSKAMKAVTYASAGEFLDVAGDWLEEREATNNLMLGLAARLAGGEVPPALAPVLMTVAASRGLAGALLMTPPHNVVLYAPGPRADEALEALIDALAAGGCGTPGCIGPSAASEAFARIWTGRTGQGVELKMAQRIYELRKVVFPEGVSGRDRPGRDEDLDILVDWRHRFAIEAIGEDDAVDMRAWPEQIIATGGALLWEDNGRIVSMAAICRPTRHGVGIGAVYTPPEQRGHGYASACVAALSQQQLDAGRQFCCLYADLANPTSNGIYRKIGYKSVADSTHYTFVAP